MNGKTNVTVSGGNDSLGGIIPLNPPTAFVVTADNAKCLLTWTDPLDKYADDLGQITDEGDQLVSQFAFTRIVRKEGGYPGTPDDGVTVTESSVRNQYQSSVYTDEGLTNNITYYYAAFTCNTDGVWSGSATGSGTPKAYDPILGNNTWEQINEVANEGIAASVWSVGDEINTTVLDGETITCVILGFNHDALSDGSGTAAITFGMKELLTNKIYVVRKSDNIFTEDGDLIYQDGPLHSYLVNTIQPSLPSDLQEYLQTVNKISSMIRRFVSGGPPYETYYSVDRTNTNGLKVFAFSIPEVYYAEEGARYGEDVWDTDGVVYEYYTTAQNRIKHLTNGSGAAARWMLRTSLKGETSFGSSTYWFAQEVYDNGNPSETQVHENGLQSGVCFGFCIGKASA